ncbi:GGDEF domain-containing protein [Aquabacterium sp. NJ1]|uniref:GGDEF domain-containing protein n=1 Tax=Aquabacterium sp. NJ1 TaxID=1538295 RepID=UPI0009DDD5F2|nr:GGDEF domain-containing protein [Aquabacterium sp. NJ1]
MQITQQTLLEQLRIADFEIDQRKSLLSFSEEDVTALLSVRALIDRRSHQLVDDFYKQQMEIPEIMLLIGDADTLQRMQVAQRRYILDLFCGIYDAEYVNNRLHIGLGHKRIGVDPKLYLASVHSLRGMLVKTISSEVPDSPNRRAVIAALDKLFFFDMTLVFDIYLRSMMQEIESSKTRLELYAQSLEKKVCERTQQLQDLSRTDPLTRLFNRRHLDEAAEHALRAAKRRSEPVSLVYLDVNDFKQINDKHGHLAGDDVLTKTGELLRTIGRSEDLCFRYGGDEFLVILPNCTEAEAKTIYWNRLSEGLSQQLPGVTLSVGISQTGTDHYMSLDELIREADERMYENKRARAEALAQARANVTELPLRTAGQPGVSAA